MSERIQRLQQRLHTHEADTLVITDLMDILWATGFTGSNALLAVTPDRAHFLTDGRYIAQSQAEVSGAAIHIMAEDLLGALSNLIPASRVVFQEEILSFRQFAQLSEIFPKATLIPVSELTTSLRASKDEAELEAIRWAQRITERVFDQILPLIRPGVTEQEIATEIVYLHLRSGASKVSFDPIVAGGPNGALPHGRPTDRPFQNGDVIVIDMGGYTNGYASDMTRTIALGEPSPEFRRAYEAVNEARAVAVEAVAAGVSGKYLDEMARAVLRKTNLEQYFTHSLGHGVGLDIHEWPRLSQHVEHILPENAVVTIEPGIYIPGEFGIRIEDMVIARKDRAEIITLITRELIVC